MNAALAADARHLGDRLDDAGLVVDEHHRHETGVVAQGGQDGVRIDEAAAGGRDDRHGMSAARQLLQRLEHGRVLDGGCHNVMNPAPTYRAEDRGVVRLGSAAGKDDVPRGRADQ